ncbi:hypothetical protein QBC36DRAFT_337284 [Triangularia setosa]|uniref:Uncharacterized protein n=1 Tax=Triangularia setosa TaxID=2587417 RepID=A0AAN7A3H9_9PEZI|nr:hypothetical protein QBC36DRAFT_337284 [Podospora setosa]
MSFQYSVTKDASLFGLNVELDVHLLRLEAAKTFTQIRRDVERNITTLKTLTPNSFGKRRSKDSFKDNVELVVNESGALMPLVEKLGSDEPSINILILACFTLCKTTHANLEKHNLTNVFVEFLACVVNDCTIFPSMREKFIELIKDVCRKKNNITSGKLLGAVDSEGGSRKRRRLNPPSPHSRAEQDEESLVFGPEVLSPLEVEIETGHSSVPPNHVPKEVVFQFTAARVGRLEGMLKGSPLIQAVKTSNQWRWERSRDMSSTQNSGQRTDTIVALIPESSLQDISFLLKVGHRTGWKIVEFLEFESSVTQVIS